MSNYNRFLSALLVLCFFSEFAFSEMVSVTSAENQAKKSVSSYIISNYKNNKAFNNVIYNSINSKYYWLSQRPEAGPVLYASDTINSHKVEVKKFASLKTSERRSSFVGVGEDGSLFVASGAWFYSEGTIKLKVFRSVDFGRTWVEISSELSLKDRQVALRDFKVKNKDYYFVSGLDKETYGRIFEVNNKKVNYYHYSEYYGAAQIKTISPKLTIQVGDKHLSFNGHTPSYALTNYYLTMNYDYYGFRKIYASDDEGTYIKAIEVNKSSTEESEVMSLLIAEPFYYTTRHRVMLKSDSSGNLFLYQGNLKFVDVEGSPEGALFMSIDEGKTWKAILKIHPRTIVSKMEFVNNNLVIFTGSIHNSVDYQTWVGVPNYKKH